MKSYIDTSVIVSAYKPNETAHKASLRIAKLNTIGKVASPILVTELFCVLSRLYTTSQIIMPPSVKKVLSRLSAGEAVYALVNAIILDWNLSCPNLGFEAKQLKLKDLNVLMPEAMLDACTLATSLSLKTLDLMHIAAAKIINESTRDLKYFVTLDHDILNARNEIERTVGFQPLTPQELAHRERNEYD